jgi:hypothetical protein
MRQLTASAKVRLFQIQIPQKGSTATFSGFRLDREQCDIDHSVGEKNFIFCQDGIRGGAK